MTAYFLDTSALAKYYHQEIGSEIVERLFVSGSTLSLILEHATARSLRTLDALQLAVAVDLRDAGLSDHFVCSDVNLCKVASVADLDVIDPERVA